MSTGLGRYSQRQNKRCPNGETESWGRTEWSENSFQIKIEKAKRWV